jgi:membrane protein
MFTLLYKVAPAQPVPLWTALVGGVITAVLFEVAKHGFRWYVGLARQGTLGPASGSLGALILLLLWIYYSALVFILGAEAAFGLDRRRAAWLARIEERRRHAIDHATALAHREKPPPDRGELAADEASAEDKRVARR